MDEKYLARGIRKQNICQSVNIYPDIPDYADNRLVIGSYHKINAATGLIQRKP